MKYELWGSYISGDKMVMLAKTTSVVSLTPNELEDLSTLEKRYPNLVQRFEIDL